MSEMKRIGGAEAAAFSLEEADEAALAGISGAVIGCPSYMATMTPNTHRLGAVALGQSIVHHEVGDALLIEPVRGQIALVTIGEYGITATRHTYDSLA